MPDWDLLESVRFFYHKRDKPGHDKLVARVKAEIGQAKTFLGLDCISIVVSEDVTNPEYGRAFERCEQFYCKERDGMPAMRTSTELSAYVKYLAETFGLRPTEREVKLLS